MKLKGSMTQKGQFLVRRKGETEIIDSHDIFTEAVETCDENAPGVFEILQPIIERNLRFVEEPPAEEPPPNEEPPPQEEPPTEEPPPPPPAGEFKGFDLPPLVFNQPITGSAPVPLPALGGSFIDPMSGLKITRASDGKARHNYSRRQVWNKDETYYIVYVVDVGSWELHDDATEEKIKTLPFLGGDNCEPLWHPTDPKLLWYMGDGLTWYEFNVDTGARRVLFTLEGRLPFSVPSNTWAWTKGEGRASDDGTVLFLMLTSYSPATDVQWHGIACVNPMTGEIYGAKQTSERYDHCSTSRSGRWGVYSGRTTFALDRTLTEKRHLYDGTQHSDLAYSHDMDDVIVYAQFQSADDDRDGKDDDGSMMYHNIDTGEVDDLLGTYVPQVSGYTEYHICGLGLPGYVLVSAQEDSIRDGQPLGEIYRRVCIIEIQNGGTKQLVTPTRQQDKDYFDEPQATCNRTMTKGMFASTMGPKEANNGYSSSWIVDIPHKQ